MQKINYFCAINYYVVLAVASLPEDLVLIFSGFLGCVHADISDCVHEDISATYLKNL